MQTVTLSPRFQVVIPRRVRESMGLRSAEKAHVTSFRNRIEIIPLRDVRKLRGYLSGIDSAFQREDGRV
jgi:AbrB family looped-hinge helix DNA binding protein